MALNLEISGFEREHAQITSVQCSKAQCKYHMEEITGTDLYICKNRSYEIALTELVDERDMSHTV